MNNLKKHIFNRIAIIFCAIFIGGCTHNFEEINTNPFDIEEATPEQLFNGVVIESLDLVAGLLNDQMFNTYASYYGGKGGQFNRFFFTANTLDLIWKSFYVDILNNNQEIITLFSDDPAFANRVYIAKIWKSYIFSILVSTFGDVPYQEALTGEPVAAYDTEEFIYTSILAELKDAAENINTSGDRLQQDPIFNGDLLRWKKFANTLRLKIALRISEGFPTLAAQHGTDAMANEADLVSSNADNVAMKWGTAQENWSFNYTRYVFVQANEDVIPYMNFHFLLNLKTYNDPRLFKLAEPSPAPITITDQVFESGSNTNLITVEYEVPYFGRPLGGNAVVEGWDLNGANNILSGLSNNRYSRPKQELFFTQDMSYNIITYSETNFIKAEANLLGWGGSKTAEQYYYDGIDASFEQYEATGVDEYKNRNGIQWGTTSVGDRGLYGVVTSGISADPIDKIARQRWLASFNQGHDIWCMQRRNRRLPLIDQFAPDGGTGLVYAPLPERMVYPEASEQALNRNALQAAIARLTTALPTFISGNTLYSTLKINQIYTPVIWEDLDAQLNQDFATHFYGDSEDDLIAAGVNYTKI